jgi:hypothetical protein
MLKPVNEEVVPVDSDELSEWDRVYEQVLGLAGKSTFAVCWQSRVGRSKSEMTRESDSKN